MKKDILFCVLSIILIDIVPKHLLGQTDLNINGFIKTDNRLQYESEAFTWNMNQLNLKFEGSLDKYHFFSEVRLRGFGLPEVSQSSDLQRQEKDQVFRWGLEFREAYLDLYGFGLDNLDLRLGRQIVTWGTADKLNPTSNISPDDLEDIFNFGEQLGTNALKATYYLNDYTFTGVFVPVFTPAVLPYGDFVSALSPTMNMPVGITMRNISDSVILPANTLSESSQFAIKAATCLFDYDLSVSYFKGRDDLPLMNQVTMVPVDTLGTVDIETELIYPKIQVIGADFAGSIASVGIWGEGALILPDKVNMPIFVQTQEGLVEQNTSVVLDDTPFVRYVIGGDYTFKNGLYLNAQYLHGFMHERDKDDLNDYFVFRFEKKFFNDELKLVPLGGVIAVNDWDDWQNNYGFVANPEITYYPADNIELILGTYLLDGKGNNLFSQIKTADEFYFKATVNF